MNTPLPEDILAVGEEGSTVNLELSKIAFGEESPLPILNMNFRLIDEAMIRDGDHVENISITSAEIDLLEADEMLCATATIEEAQIGSLMTTNGFSFSEIADRIDKFNAVEAKTISAKRVNFKNSILINQIENNQVFRLPNQFDVDEIECTFTLSKNITEEVLVDENGDIAIAKEDPQYPAPLPVDPLGPQITAINKVKAIRGAQYNLYKSNYGQQEYIQLSGAALEVQTVELTMANGVVNVDGFITPKNTVIYIAAAFIFKATDTYDLTLNSSVAGIESIPQQVFDTDHPTTMANIVAAIDGLSSVGSCVLADISGNGINDTIVITGNDPSATLIVTTSEYNGSSEYAGAVVVQDNEVGNMNDVTILEGATGTSSIKFSAPIEKINTILEKISFKTLSVYDDFLFFVVVASNATGTNLHPILVDISSGSDNTKVAVNRSQVIVSWVSKIDVASLMKSFVVTNNSTLAYDSRIVGNYESPNLEPTGLNRIFSETSKSLAPEASTGDAVPIVDIRLVDNEVVVMSNAYGDKFLSGSVVARRY